MKLKNNDNLIRERKLKEQAELIEYFEKQNDLQQDEIRELKNENIALEEKNLSSDLTIAKANNKIEEQKEKINLLEDRIKYLESTIEKYQQLPDLKNMIDNLSTLTTPSIDKLIEVMEKSNFNDFSNLESSIDGLYSKVDETIYRINELARRASTIGW